MPKEIQPYYDWLKGDKKQKSTSMKKKTKKKSNPAQDLLDKVRSEKIRPDMNQYLGSIKAGTKVSNPKVSQAQSTIAGSGLSQRLYPWLPDNLANKIGQSKLGQRLSPANIQISPNLLTPKVPSTTGQLMSPDVGVPDQSPYTKEAEQVALRELAGQFYMKNRRADPDLDYNFMKAWNTYKKKVGGGGMDTKDLRDFLGSKNMSHLPGELYEKVAAQAGDISSIPAELKPYYYWMKDGKKSKKEPMKKKISLSEIGKRIKTTGRNIKGAYSTAFKNWVDDRVDGMYPKKKKAKMVVNNNMKAFGQMDPKTNVVEVNLKKHKGDKTELANTIHHELLHDKHPDMSERDVKNKADRETNQMSQVEKERLVAKVRNKKMHYKQGAMKRKFKMGRSDTKPGDFIRKANEAGLSKRNLAIRGLV